ncbi:DUF4440 domain-containing protein [Reinekea blandensis]|uniref:DUF4440 domain-containing protein n=1 Tax=Reinekea blandensis MED297 TaxID=314283 RepID=A4BDE6_9GAMM|nr:DUF4440 domain-containing protein [Reinekea blandensis]EAR09890.1 hypothetical protein MED297_06059 [Reinekea sp. MED297] [Reinekea blandensis MED297]
MTVKNQLIELETSLLTFEVRHSKERLCELIAPDFQEIGASGAYFGRDEILERLPTEQDWHATVQDFEFRELTPGLCQLIFRAFITHDKDDDGVYSLRSSLWQKNAIGWQVVFHQGTQVAPFPVTGVRVS